MSKHEKQPGEGSALLNVFGSHVSLAELNGDMGSRTPSRVPSRVPSRPASPHEATTKRARSKTVTERGPLRGPQRSPLSLALCGALLYASGALVLHSAAHFAAVGRLGPDLQRSFPNYTLLLANLAGITAVAVGLLFSRTSASAATHYDWPSFVRGAGAILGLSYATTKIQSAWMFWALANPILWYLVDSSVEGFAYAAAFSVVAGGAAASFLAPNWHTALIVLSFFFSAAVVWGGLGRRLLAGSPRRPLSR